MVTHIPNVDQLTHNSIKNYFDELFPGEVLSGKLF